MATLPTRSLSALVQAFAAGVQGRAAALIDFSTGSTLRAVAEATGGVALWLQSIALRILLTTRAATSTGSDLDSFVADFGLERRGATYATGEVTFRRLTAGATAVTIPIGTQVRTSDDSQIFVVTLDPANVTYSAAAGGYVLASLVASITVPVSALTPGTAANVAAGAITQVLSTIPGIDTVTNASDFSNATDGESDPSLRLRFKAYIAQLSKGTKAAIGFALSSLSTSIQYTITENETRDGNALRGFFYCVVDDGSGAASDQLVADAYAAVDAVRALGVSFAVYAPTVITANYAMTITVAEGYVFNDVVAAVQGYVNGAIRALGLGAPLYYTQVIRWAYQASPGVVNVVGVTINGGTADVTVTPSDTVKPGSASIS